MTIKFATGTVCDKHRVLLACGTPVIGVAYGCEAARRSVFGSVGDRARKHWLMKTFNNTGPQEPRIPS